VAGQVAGILIFATLGESYMAGGTVGQMAAHASIGLDLFADLLGNLAPSVFVSVITVNADRPSVHGVTEDTERIVLGIYIYHEKIAVQIVVGIVTGSAFDEGILVELDSYGTQYCGVLEFRFRCVFKGDRMVIG
jgi:hypothetical protein